MANDPIEQRSRKPKLLLGLSLHMEPYLAQPKQIEVVNRESRSQNQQPTKGIASVKDPTPDAIVDGPNGAAKGLPFPEKQEQSRAAC
jgi:hypothetical protein